MFCLCVWECALCTVCGHVPATAHDAPRHRGLNQCHLSSVCQSVLVNAGTNLLTSLSAVSSVSHSFPPLSILSTATCEPQRRRSVQDLPGICTESNQVGYSQLLEMICSVLAFFTGYFKPCCWFYILVITGIKLNALFSLKPGLCVIHLSVVVS